MSGMTTIAIYDPRRLSREDFLAGFVAREELVEFLLAQLRLSLEGEARHRLILGQRGLGKTSLLRRLQIGIGDDPILAVKLLPLTFREEQYNVRSANRFWRNCGEALAEALENEGDAAAAARLDEELVAGDWLEPDRAGEAFAARMVATGRRAVLLVDNLDLILNAIPPDQHWHLRRALQAPGGPILIAAATQLPRQIGDHEAAFYEFFQWDMLEPLTEAEMFTCLRRLAEANPDSSAAVLRTLRTQPARLRVLHTLTGGSPRILVLLYGLLERADSDTVHSDLEGLLDQVTPLYKARVEELRSDLQRAIFDAIALNWDPITSRNLSAATGVEITSLPSVVAKLREFGLIEEVPTSGARAGFQMCERFFNVWYLMRHGTRRTRQRVRWLTAFLETFYSVDEIRELLGRLTSKATSDAWAGLLGTALRDAIERVDPDEVPGTEMVPSALVQIMGKALPAGDGMKRAIAREANTFREFYSKHPWMLALLAAKMFEVADQRALADEAACLGVGLAPVSSEILAFVLLVMALRDTRESTEAALRVALRAGVGDAYAALVGFYVLTGCMNKAREHRRGITGTDNVLALLADALLELGTNNFGNATHLLNAALTESEPTRWGSFIVIVFMLLRLFHGLGHGERLIDWFIESGQADRWVALYAAFVAYVRGVHSLLDFNPEVRAPAEIILILLSGSTAPSAPVASPAKGRPRSTAPATKPGRPRRSARKPSLKSDPN